MENQFFAPMSAGEGQFHPNYLYLIDILSFSYDAILSLILSKNRNTLTNAFICPTIIMFFFLFWGQPSFIPIYLPSPQTVLARLEIIQRTTKKLSSPFRVPMASYRYSKAGPAFISFIKIYYHNLILNSRLSVNSFQTLIIILLENSMKINSGKEFRFLFISIKLNMFLNLCNFFLYIFVFIVI